MRCDRCGARALNKVTKDGETEFGFCGHHTNEHAPKLRELGYDIVALEPELATQT